VDLRQQLSEELNPNLREINIAAMEDWKRRKQVGDYLLVVSDYPKDVRGAIVTFAIYDNLDTSQFIISSMSGQMIYVQHVDPSIVERLKTEIKGNTFTFGANRCWGVNNQGQEQPVTLEQVLKVLGLAQQ